MSVASSGMAASAVSAYIMPTDAPLPPIYFSYNPETGFNIKRTARWKTTTQSGARSGHTQQQYEGNEPASLTVDILLDAFAIPPAPPQAGIEILASYLKPIPIPDPKNPRPPTVMFGWGPNIIMSTAVVTEVNISHKRFLLGVPTRAIASVTLVDAASLELPGTNPTSGGLATRKTYTMVEGDTLASVAYDEYRDPAKWRAIAIANEIDDPMRVKPGTELVIPEKRDADALMS